MATWAPTVDEVTNLVHAWRLSANEPFVHGLIENAVHEVVGEVGDFDPSEVINPSSPESDWVTLGDLAHDAAAIRAAHQWASSVAPEFGDPEFVSQLYARYVDALARLSSWGGGSRSAFTISPTYSPPAGDDDGWVVV